MSDEALYFDYLTRHGQWRPVTQPRWRGLYWRMRRLGGRRFYRYAYPRRVLAVAP